VRQYVFSSCLSRSSLTLNVLLSFAQFEREVTGERIRDKIAASKQKGMWMGGLVPLGYEVHERRLNVNQSEAETVREIFQRYLELGCVRLLMEELNRRGIRSKVRVAKNGKRQAGTRSSVARSIFCFRIPSRSARFVTRVSAIRVCTNRTWIESYGRKRSVCFAVRRFGAGRVRKRSPVRTWVDYSTKAPRA